MQSKAKSVEQYLKELPPDRREALETVRRVIKKNLDKGYQEGMGYGMMGWSVPHSIYPAGYHCDPKQPLPFAGLASQKQYMSVYLMCIYGHSGEDAWFRSAWAKTGKKLDMGKSCIRFKKVDDLALDVIGEAIRRMPVKKFVAFYESALLSMNKAAAAQNAAKKKSAKPTARVGKAGKKATPSKKSGSGSRR